MIGELLSIADLKSSDRDEMLRLLACHFDNVSRETFEEDLAAKQWIIRICAGTTLLGFSSLRYLTVPFGSENLPVLYSGDTIVAPAARGSTTLARTWIAAVRWLRDYYAAPDLRWLLLVSGFRTYRFLPVFWESFLPSRRRQSKGPEFDRMQAVAQSMFGPRYDERTGIVRLASPQVHRPDRDGIAVPRLSDPDVAFFQSSNPGFTRGDELVCWTRLAPDNLTRSGRGIWNSAPPVAASLRPVARTHCRPAC